MSFNIVLLLISIPVLAVCAFAIYMGMSGLEKKKEKRVNDRKALENQLIWNGMREYRDAVTGFKGMSRKNVSWKDVKWEQEMWGNKPIVGLDEPLNYDPLGWIAGLPFSTKK